MKPLVTFGLRRLPPGTRPHRPRPLRSDLTSPLPGEEGGPRVLFTRDGKAVPLHDAWKNQHCFLLCGGPSLKTLDLSKLHGRGLCSMAVNNAWLMHRPTFWVCADPPDRFSDLGWKDPSVLKFIPFVHVKKKLREGTASGLQVLDRTPSDMPSTFYYVRNDGFNPGTFLTEDGVSWGTLKKTSDSVGIRNSRSVMLCALKILPWLGFTSIYLLGCDFHMPMGHGPAYAWDEQKNRKARTGNNSLYANLTTRLTALKPFLDGRGVSIFNCNPTSALKVFPHLPYEDALVRAQPPFVEGITKGWYS